MCFSDGFCGLLRFTRNIRGFRRLAMLWWSRGWIPRNCTQIRPCGGAEVRSCFIDVFVDSWVSLGTFVVVGAWCCCRGLQGGFLETVRRFDHVAALQVACPFPMFRWTLAFHSEHSLFFVASRCCYGLRGGFLETVRDLDHVVALRVACLFQLFSWTLAFHSDLRRCWRLAMLWLCLAWIPRSSRQHR